MKLNHVGIAVHNVEIAAKEYQKLGFTVSEPHIQADHGVRVVFVMLENTTLELLEPWGDKSPIQSFLNKRGPGIHHLAIGVTDIDASLCQLKNLNVQLIDQEPRQGAHDHLVAFLHPKATSSGVLIELCESQL